MIDYQNNPKAVHEKHYFKIETELYTKVRWYIRHSWHLGVVTMTNNRSERLEKYYDDLERIQTNRKYYEALLFVRLWAAAASQPIPTYTSLPENIYLEPFLHITDDDDIENKKEDTENDEEEEEEEVDTDESSTKVSDASPAMSEPTVSTGVIDVDDDEVL